jgi:hypothetical protein
MEHAATTTPNRDFVEQLIDKLHQLAEEDRLEDASVFYSQFKEFIEEEEDILVEVD